MHGFSVFAQHYVTAGSENQRDALLGYCSSRYYARLDSIQPTAHGRGTRLNQIKLKVVIMITFGFIDRNGVFGIG